MKMIAYASLLVCLGSPALAHHSTLGFYDPQQTIEIEGTLASLSMVNPHVRFVVAVTDASGAPLWTGKWKPRLSASCARAASTRTLCASAITSECPVRRRDADARR